MFFDILLTHTWMLKTITSAFTEGLILPDVQLIKGIWLATEDRCSLESGDMLLHLLCIVSDHCVCVCLCACLLMDLCCHQGIVLSVHLSSQERSHSATPVAVRALCPAQCISLLLPPSITPLPPSLLLLTAASSAVSTGCRPTPRSMSCLSGGVWALAPALVKMHTYCMHALTLKWVLMGFAHPHAVTCITFLCNALNNQHITTTALSSVVSFIKVWH